MKTFNIFDKGNGVPVLIKKSIGCSGCLRHRASLSRGFALIATIVIMVLLVMVALAILSLSTIELRNGQNDKAVAEAQANARLALMLAIGELQRNLGPDQRVNANASLYLIDQTPRSQWMGVYKSWPGEQKNRPEPEFLRWMVSGNPQDLANKEAYAAGEIADSMVKLVDSGTLGSGLDHRFHVEAGKVMLDDRHALAWWVGDETSKALVPSAVPHAQSAVESRGYLMTSPRTGLERLESFQGITRDEGNLDKMMTFSSLDLLTQSKKNPHFHDVTLDSSTLMTNVRDGGMRKDLSMALEGDVPAEVKPLYTVQGLNGITMKELWTYYNLWKELDYPVQPIQHPDGGSVPPKTPRLASKIGHISSVEDPFYPYRRMTMMRATWVVSFMSRREKDPTGKEVMQLYMVVDPIITVWNPFDVAVTIDRRSFQGFKFWGIPYLADLTKNGIRRTYSVNNVFGGNFVLRLFYGLADPIVFRPGEVLVISQGAQAQTVVGRSGMNAHLRLGWNFGSGFRFPVRGYTGSAGDSLKVSFRPHSGGHMNVALTEFLHYQGMATDVFSSQSVWTGGLMVDRNLDIFERPLQATEAPQLFPTVKGKAGASFTMAEIENRKQPVLMFSLDIKTEVDPIENGNFQGKFRLRHNPKLGAYDLQSFDGRTVAATPMQVSVKALNSWKDPILDVSAAGQGYAGGSYTAEFGNQYIVTHSIPREPIHSIAAFQHSVANGSPPQHFGHDTIRDYFLQPSITHAIGNSFAPSFLAGDATEGALNNTAAADHSYLANDALWDSWFFSSISPQTSESWKSSGRTRGQRTVFEDFIRGSHYDEGHLLPIRNFRPWVKDPEKAVTTLFVGGKPTELAHEKSATYLMLRGGFNVNSTSVDAWKLLLSGLRNTKIATSNPKNSNREITNISDETVVAGLLTPFGKAISDQSLNDPKTPEQWKGYRDLTDVQIDELAEAIVRQVKLRGPFLSLADFVNRRLEKYGAVSLSGPLQAALDDDKVSINQAFRTGSREVTIAQASAAGLTNPEAEAGAAAVGIPGYVKQGDILTSVGAYLTPRSDTYRVRAYGEALSTSGKVIARAWCEAIVQRVPDYMDIRDPAERRYNELTQLINKNFGRRMNVVSFRWLNPQEI